MAKWFKRRTLLTWGIVSTTAVLGCSRQHYRDRTDREVEKIISQKNQFPEWKVENWHVYPDPRARYAEMGDPDFPPYPPDDYAAAALSPNPQKPGKGGTGRFEGTKYLEQLMTWDAENRAEELIQKQESAQRGEREAQAEISDPIVSVLVSEEQPYRIKLDQAIELALFNSREFQDRREDLYLAALPVSLERFSFAAQALSASNNIYEISGRERAEGPGSRWRLGSETSLARRFSTGAELLVRFANNIVVELGSGKPPTVSLSTLGLTLSQPLLAGAGFAVNLEPLTQTERTLLYAIRSYARFRKVFYVALAVQGNYTNNPYGLQGLSANLGRGVGANLTAQSVGFLTTAVQAATLENQQKNVAAVEQLLKLFRNLVEGGIVTELQVQRIEQRLLQSRATLLRNTQNYQDDIDNFKLQLGIPTTVPIQLDDSYLRPIKNQIERLDEIYADLSDLEINIEKALKTAEPSKVRELWKKLLTESKLVKNTRLSRNYDEIFDPLKKLTNEELLRRFNELSEKRRQLIDARTARSEKGLAESPQETENLRVLEDSLDHLRFEQSLRDYESQRWLKLPAIQQTGEKAVIYRLMLDSGLIVALQSRNERLAYTSNNWPKLPGIIIEGKNLLNCPIDDANRQIGQTALNNRLDLMNARAQVVDAWRQLSVRANALQGVADIGYNLDARTEAGSGNGLSFSGNRTRSQISLRLEPPIVRRVERNLYRAALISYQRSRRNLQSFEDNILVDVRSTLRTVRQLAQSYELQKRSLELAYAQVENARSTFLAPPDPQIRDAGGNAAALTQQLLEAQGALLQAQNDLYTLWVTYASTRMVLYRDLELLNLDSRGLWLDDQQSSISPTPTRGVSDTRLPEIPLVSVGLTTPNATGETSLVRPIKHPFPAFGDASPELPTVPSFPTSDPPGQLSQKN